MEPEEIGQVTLPFRALVERLPRDAEVLSAEFLLVAAAVNREE